MKHSFSLSDFCVPLCAVLMLVLLILQFLPFWSTGADVVSISQFLWFPSQHTEVSDLLSPHTTSQYPINDIVLPGLLMLLGSVGTLVLFLFSRRSMWVPLCTLIASAAGFLSSLFIPAFQLGNLSTAILITSLLALSAAVGNIVKRIQDFRSIKE